MRVSMQQTLTAGTVGGLQPFVLVLRHRIHASAADGVGRLAGVARVVLKRLVTPERQ